MIKLLLLLLLIPTIMYSQINTELLRSLDTTNKQTLSFTSTLYDAWGNTDVYDLLLTSRYDYKKDNQYSFVTGLYQIRYDKTTCPDPIYATDRAMLHVRTTIKYNNYLMPEFYAQYNNDRSILLKNRLLTGIGNRFEILNDTTYKLFYSPSLMVEHEQMFSNKEYNRVRFSNYISFIKHINSVFIYETIYLQPNVKDFNDIRVLNDLTAKFPIFSWLNYSISIHYRYDAAAHFGLKQNDLEVYNTLEVYFNL